MENLNEFHLTATSEQLDLMIELLTQHVALAKMMLSKIQASVLRNRLALKINHNMLFLEYLKAKRHEQNTAQVPANSN
jgi:hypothetical protein